MGAGLFLQMASEFKLIAFRGKLSPLVENPQLLLPVEF